jgi:chitin synthase
MEQNNYDTEEPAIPTRRQPTTRRPGEASRQPIERPSDVEAGLARGGVQFNAGAGAGAGGASTTAMINRKRTLIRPERQRVDPTHRNYHYLQHTQQQNMPVQASTTGNRADAPLEEYDYDDVDESNLPYNEQNYGPESPDQSPRSPTRAELMRGKSILGRELPQRIPLKPEEPVTPHTKLKKHRPGTVKRKLNEPVHMTPWVFYCRTITCCFPGSLLRCFGIPGRMQQQAWREKIGLISVIILLGGFVGFLTFGFTQAVCAQPPISFSVNEITNGYLIINGRAYDLTRSSHPAAIGVPAQSNVLYPPVNAGGLDASFMFQNVNSKCKGMITAKSGSDILQDSNGNLGWYFPCNLFKPDGSTPVNFTQGPYAGYACHTTSTARNAYYSLKVEGEVVFDWEGITNSSRNLIVYSGYPVRLKMLIS